jgi:hypothetical protein
LFGRSDQDTIGSVNTARDGTAGNGGISAKGQHLLLQDVCLSALQLLQPNTERPHFGNHFSDAESVNRDTL